jgi:hypothetical protein
MGRHHKPSKNSLKPKKNKQQGRIMYGDEIYFPNSGSAGSVTYLNNQPKIIDKPTTSHFGLLLSTQQAIEEFQVKSGMLKPFTTEYQFHYWALVARIKLEDQVLDIAIPTVLFNYKQEVTGAAVDFHLNDVEKASNDNAPAAEAIANVLVNSSFGQYISTTFGSAIEWMNVPMNTCHVHPGQLSSFSGTDYKKTINDPGICFPLADPIDQPSFSSIVCHDTINKNVGKVVRTEYRFVQKEGLDIVYNHGKCIAYWKGHTVPGSITPAYTIPGYKRKVPFIQALFTNKQYDIKEDVLVAEVVVPDLVKAPYMNTDGTDIVLTNNPLIEEIISQFDELNFSPYTEDITAERITKPTPKIYGGQGSYYNQHQNSYYNNTKPSTTSMSLFALREALLSGGYAQTVVYAWSYEKALEMYNNMETLKKQNTISSKLQSDADEDMPMTPEEMIKFMIANGIKVDEIRGKSMSQLELMFEDLVEFLEEAEEAFDAKVEPASASKQEITNIVNNADKLDIELNKNPKIQAALLECGLAEDVISTLDNVSISVILEDINW